MPPLPERKATKVPKPRGGGPEREFDKTCLHERVHGEIVHRDYAAHFFRWGYARRWIRLGHKVLDVGCGVDTPLAKVLRWKMGNVPGLYVGVDLNKLRDPPGNRWMRWLPEFDFVGRHREVLRDHGAFDVLTCFEVIEHMGRDDGRRLLRGLLACCQAEGTLLLSTPMFSGSVGAARNHVNEWTGDELAAALSETGWDVERRFGTFSSHNDIRKALSPAEAEVYAGLREYYDDDVVSCFLAPLHPEQSRNNVWVCHPRA